MHILCDISFTFSFISCPFPHLASIYVSSPWPLSLLTPSHSLHSLSPLSSCPAYFSICSPLCQHRRELYVSINNLHTHALTHPTSRIPSGGDIGDPPVHTSLYTRTLYPHTSPVNTKCVWRSSDIIISYHIHTWRGWLDTQIFMA